MKRDRNGIPILGALTAEEVRVDEVIAEKVNLGPEDHDWQVIVAYGISNAEAAAAYAESADPNAPKAKVLLMQETVAGIVGPLCGKCKMLYAMVHAEPCIDPVDRITETLDEDTRRALIARLQQDERDANPMVVATSAVDGYDYTLDDGTVVNQPSIPGVVS